MVADLIHASMHPVVAVRDANNFPQYVLDLKYHLYARAYEAKFVTGAVAGAMAKDGRIGYICDYPIYGMIAGINAFALGAQMVNPDAKVYLE